MRDDLVGLPGLSQPERLLDRNLVERIHRHLHVRELDAAAVRLHPDLDVVVDHPLDRDQDLHGFSFRPRRHGCRAPEKKTRKHNSRSAGVQCAPGDAPGTSHAENPGYSGSIRTAFQPCGAGLNRSCASTARSIDVRSAFRDGTAVIHSRHETTLVPLLPGGDLRAIIGPNGAGKTLFNLSSGMPAADAGSIAFRGQEITGLSPHAISRMGIGEHCREIALAMRPNLLLLDERVPGMSPDQTKNTVAKLHPHTGPPLPALCTQRGQRGVGYVPDRAQSRKSDASKSSRRKPWRSILPPPNLRRSIWTPIPSFQAHALFRTSCFVMRSPCRIRTSPLWKSSMRSHPLLPSKMKTSSPPRPLNAFVRRSPCPQRCRDCCSHARTRCCAACR